MAAPLIELADVSRVYGRGETEVRALDHVNLTINQGEFVAIMGPSGSGKSTAMNTIGLLDRPDAGRFLFNGVEVQGLDRDRRALLRRHFLGFVSERCSCAQAQRLRRRSCQLSLIHISEPTRPY